MRLAVLSDIHGNLPALEAVLRDVRDRGADAVVNLGDSLSGPLLAQETAQFLMTQDWMTIAGNHERQMLGPGPWGRSDACALAQLAPGEQAWLARHPPSAWFTPEVLLCHGTPASDLEGLLETPEPGRARAASAAEIQQRLGPVRAPVVLCGHTHVQRAVRSRSGQLIVNPGSVGLQALQAEQPFPHLVETGSPDARYAILDRRDGGWIPALISVPYEFRAMAGLAASRDRPDWACALRSGYLS